MTQETVIKTIQRFCNGKAAFSIHGAISTESVYCVIRVGNAETKIRVSDHKAPKNKNFIKTFVWGKHTKTETIERFVANTIEYLRHKSINIAMENISKKDL